MITKEEAKKKIAGFLELYRKHCGEKIFEGQKEANTEKYVEELFVNLGWERLTDLERQHNVKSGEVDYSVNLRGKPYFFIEVKKYKEELDKHRKQAVDYAFLSGQKWVVLTNLREIRVYNAQYRDQPEEIIRLFRPIKIEELLDRFDDLYVLSKLGAEENLIEKRAIDMSKVKIKEPISILSGALLNWRSLLTKEMKAHPRLNEISGKNREAADEWVDEAVQMLLNRFIFLRTIEDLGHWRFSIRTILNSWREKKKKPLMEHISDFFREVNDQYNAGLFVKHPCENLILADQILEQVIAGVGGSDLF